jgi:hypothetical protein
VTGGDRRAVLAEDHIAAPVQAVFNDTPVTANDRQQPGRIGFRAGPRRDEAADLALDDTVASPLADDL